MCVLIFSTNLSQTFLIKRRIQGNIIINMHRYSGNEAVILLRLFYWILDMSHRFWKNIQISKFWRQSVQWEPRCSMRTDRRTNIHTYIHDKANSRLTKFCETRLKMRSNHIFKSKHTSEADVM